MSRVTVLMPVYNGECFLRDAVESILSQTFCDFELLIVNDASTDSTVDILNRFNDPRIRIIQNDTNIGVAKSLNRGILDSESEFIARMDADDISYPQRLSVQLDYLDRNPDVIVCGSWIRYIGAIQSRLIRYSSDPNFLRAELLFNSPMAHPTVMFRRQCFVNNGLLYDYRHEKAEDFELWGRASAFGQLSNIQLPLLDYRIHATQIKNCHNSGQLEAANLIRRLRLQELGIEPSEVEFALHQAASTYVFKNVVSENTFKQLDHWLIKIWEANKIARPLPEDGLVKILVERWYASCVKAMLQGIVSVDMIRLPGVMEKSNFAWSDLLKHVLSRIRKDSESIRNG